MVGNAGMKRFSLLLAAVAAACVSILPARADLVQSLPQHQADAWKEYCTKFHDPANNNGWSDCPASATPVPTPNADIDVEGLLFKNTIRLEDPDTFAAVDALTHRLVQPEVKQSIPTDTFDVTAVRERIMMQQHLNAARAIAYDTIASMIGRRMPVGPTEAEKAAMTTPIPQPVPVTPPDPAAAPAPGSTDLKFDVAVGDGIANALQREGHMGGGQCPDNDKQSCHFFYCDTTKNLTGGTCIGRPATAVTAAINALPAGSLDGKNVLLSSGVSNEPASCPGEIGNQVNALLAKGAARIVIAGAYQGTTRGENPIDLAAVDTCIQSAVGGNPKVAILPGFAASYDHYKPADPAAYLVSAQAALNSIGGAPTTTPNPGITCPDGTPGPPCTAP